MAIQIINQPIEGATALDLDEIEGLKPKHIAIQKDLNEWEHNNIIKAEMWCFSTKHQVKQILSLSYLKAIHEKMFSDTWRWAGQFRSTAKNIGVDAAEITSELKKLLDDVAYQINHSVYSIDEIAYRFHHRLVKIHPFPNGNGRHARLMTDLLLVCLNQSRFSWGENSLAETGPTRKRYIEALKAADKGNYHLLAAFVRS